MVVVGVVMLRGGLVCVESNRCTQNWSVWRVLQKKSAREWDLNQGRLTCKLSFSEEDLNYNILLECQNSQSPRLGVLIFSTRVRMHANRFRPDRNRFAVGN